ncbi:MAG: hypothetical protein JOY62_19335 [Acidobacteriaceae bacterium]|nr:hypothetical protein [Acidobacteriaceae bacterium]MBV9782120.1 hypothetical protein [Acidobacteriaceae bacterium]
MNFRLTDDEYQTLQKACVSTGARSISDYARSVLLAMLPDETGRQRPDMSRRIDQLETRVSALSAAIRAIEGLLPNGEAAMAAMQGK